LLDDSLPRVRIRPLHLVLLFAALTGCPSEPAAPTPDSPGCGDGVVASDESCDDGDGNGDTPDACRSDCTLPFCGDGVVDPLRGEECDDGGQFGGDGCSPTCIGETLPGETEDNGLGDGNALPPGGEVVGGLPRGDVDCFSTQLLPGGWLAADVTNGETGSCPEDVVLRLVGPGGGQVATGTPGLNGCSPIDPLLDEGARFVEGGNWQVCVEGFLGNVVPTYSLAVTTGEDSCTLDVPFTSTSDPDGDGLTNLCDVDDDGDGFDDEDDNCPETPNGPNTPPLFVDDEGFLRTWLVAGPFADLPPGGEGGSCEVSDEDPLGDESLSVPQLGSAAGDLEWFAYFDSNARFNFLHVMGGPTPREVYAAAWIRSPMLQDGNLSMGIDDGGRAYWNGEEVFEVGSCQGTNVDQFQAPVVMLEGWNQLLIRVRDQGGGWGLYTRLLDGDGEPMVGLEVSLTGPEPFSPGQEDTDGDGLGDWCDPTPNGE